MKDLITEIAQALVDQPEKVFVNEIEGSYSSVLELNVAKNDLGKVIGKQGRTAKAIRTILALLLLRFGKGTYLRLLSDGI